LAVCQVQWNWPGMGQIRRNCSCRAVQNPPYGHFKWCNKNHTKLIKFKMLTFKLFNEQNVN
jgi:hypothetical protein